MYLRRPVFSPGQTGGAFFVLNWHGTCEKKEISVAYIHNPNRMFSNDFYRLQDKCDMLESYLVRICTELEEARSLHRLPLKVVQWWENLKKSQEG